MKTRIRSISVKGFRAYGAPAQTLNLPTDIAVVWGPNSKGKTSLAEAFEFLLTGRITRRKLTASSQDEFADALRNAHLADDENVSVTASITTPNSRNHSITRTLTSDYTKRQDCASRLEIDGAVATEDNLANFGLSLSQPPFQAPVLAQHTLSYVFSIRPQDRATFFKTLLEVTDLDDLRNEIAGLQDILTPPNDPTLNKFDSCSAIPVLAPALGPLGLTVPDFPAFTTQISVAAGALISDAAEDVPNLLDDRLNTITRILSDRRGKTFPVRWFERENLAGWTPPAQATWNDLDAYLEEAGKVDEETRRLVALFDEALKLPMLTSITESIDCPLCGEETVLTPRRVQAIRQHVENVRDFKTAERAAKTFLSQLLASVEVLATATQSALPRYLKATAVERRRAGFTILRIRELLADRGDVVVRPWLVSIRALMRSDLEVRRTARIAASTLRAQTPSLLTDLDPEKLHRRLDELATARSSFARALSAYDVAVQPLTSLLNEVIDIEADTAGWQDFLDLASVPETLRNALIERKARATVDNEFRIALREIDRAKERVLDDKFGEYSSLIQEWWERLRPDEPTYFSGVQPRKGAKRTIDFKAGLSAKADRSSPKIRDVIAVFSHSQLHCLGLALFLARAQHEGLDWIVLDDPVLSSDDDYRVHFNSTVLTALLDLQIQVVIFTQDHDTWEQLETRYRHRGISTAQLFVDTPAEGSIIDNTSDALLAKITRAKSLAWGGHPDSRKECGIQLRDAGERFCKESLVNERRAGGDPTASLTDYDGKTLEWLCPRVEPLLDGDPSHPGKLGVFRSTVNHACHDNAPPSNSAMIQACGEIAFLQKKYLPR